MKQPFKPPRTSRVSSDGPPLRQDELEEKWLRKGMTPDELDALIIEMAQKCPMIVFEYHQLDRERGLAIMVRYGLGNHWGPIYNAEMWRKVIPEVLYEIEQVAYYYEKYGKIGISRLLFHIPRKEMMQMTPKQAREYIESHLIKKIPLQPIIEIHVKMGMTISKCKSLKDALVREYPGIILEDETYDDESVGFSIQCGEKDWETIWKPQDIRPSDLEKAKRYAELRKDS